MGQKSGKFVEVARSDDVSLEVQIGHIENQVCVRVESDEKVNLFNAIVSDVKRQVLIVVHDQLLRDSCEATAAQLVICQVQVLNVLPSAKVALSRQDARDNGATTRSIQHIRAQIEMKQVKVVLQ